MKDEVISKNSQENMVDVTPFAIKDCALIVRICDLLPAINLRELHERVANCPVDSLYHHFCETAIRPSFDDPEFHNDFARWARRALHDHVLAERLEILHPYSFPHMEELRKEILDIIADRLSEIHYIPWALHDQAFFFKQATTVVFDTNRIIETPEHLCDAVKEMSTSSLYYHFWEARRRTPEKIDDFSFWLKGWNDRGKPLIDAFSRIDFYFMSLKELQDKLCTVMEEVGKTWRKK
ncbi:MAG: hypothetical protein DRP46_02570 [Candidatus Zixiibacteriota bacterium]|nr:MAG: hypothetical protein DRP46_02570 [candidate division Zixibacteria bacterium]HDL04062.1 hypothetical protein [candidate division Zixibacteria bacterium]